MELDTLKNKLKASIEDSSVVRSPAQLATYLHTRSVSTVSKIKRSMVVEWLLIAIFMSIFFFTLQFYHFIYTTVLASMGIGIGIVISIYLWVVFKKINFVHPAQPTKDYLQQAIDSIEVLTKLYFQLNMALLPAIGFVGLLTMYLQVEGNPALPISFQWKLALGLYLTGFLVWGIISYCFTKWYIRKAFGQYLEQLKEQLKELEEGSSHLTSA
jgi:hypothetical protein